MKRSDLYICFRLVWAHPKGLFTSSKSEHKIKKIKEQSEEIKVKISNIKENFRFRIRFLSLWTEPKIDIV